MKCSWWSYDYDDEEPDVCQNEATGWRNCGFTDGNFCDQHRCRCKLRVEDETERCVVRGEE